MPMLAPALSTLLRFRQLLRPIAATDDTVGNNSSREEFHETPRRHRVACRRSLYCSPRTWKCRTLRSTAVFDPNPGTSCGSCHGCRCGQPINCDAYTFLGYFGFGPRSSQVFVDYPYAGFAEYMTAPASSLVTHFWKPIPTAGEPFVLSVNLKRDQGPPA